MIYGKKLSDKLNLQNFHFFTRLLLSFKLRLNIGQESAIPNNILVRILGWDKSLGGANIYIPLDTDRKHVPGTMYAQYCKTMPKLCRIRTKLGNKR